MLLSVTEPDRLVVVNSLIVEKTWETHISISKQLFFAFWCMLPELVNSSAWAIGIDALVEDDALPYIYDPTHKENCTSASYVRKHGEAEQKRAGTIRFGYLCPGPLYMCAQAPLAKAVVFSQMPDIVEVD